MKKHILSIFALICMSLPPAICQEVAVDPSFAMSITGQIHDPVALSMGGAGMLSTSHTAFAAFDSSAALPFSDSKGDIAAGAEYYPSTSGLDYIAGAAFKLGKFGICAAGYLSGGEMVQGMDENGISIGEFQSRDLKLALGLSYRLVDYLSLGVNLRYARQDLYPEVSIAAPGVDAFLMGKFGGFKAAAGVANLSSGVKSESGVVFPTATSIVAAFGYGIDAFEAEAKAEYILPSGDVADKYPLSISAGASYTFAKIASIRAGYCSSKSQVGMRSYLSAGAGLCIAGVHLDAAYLISDTLPTAVLSLGFKF